MSEDTPKKGYRQPSKFKGVRATNKKEYYAKYYTKNREHILKRRRNYYRANRERILNADREKACERMRTYVQGGEQEQIEGVQEGQQSSEQRNN